MFVQIHNNMSVFDLISFEDPKKVGGSIKATIHKTGKLGFSSGAEEFMSINENSFYKVGFNNESENEETIYMVDSSTGDSAFKVSKAGNYYYINLKNVFDKRGWDYKNRSYIFDIRKEKNEEIEYYILTKRKK